jgi:hypothetical protein
MPIMPSFSVPQGSNGGSMVGPKKKKQRASLPGLALVHHLSSAAARPRRNAKSVPPLRSMFTGFLFQDPSQDSVLMN